MSTENISNIKELKFNSDVEKAIQDFKALVGTEQTQAIVILAIDKKHTPSLFTSTINNYQLSYLSAFLQREVLNRFGPFSIKIEPSQPK